MSRDTSRAHAAFGGRDTVPPRDKPGDGCPADRKTSAAVDQLSRWPVDNLISITLPWPPKALSPNTRHAHWSALARAKKRFRSACAMVARQQGAGRLQADQLAVCMTFVPPDLRARDLDNCIAAMKSGLDGLADVLGVDDSRWEITPVLEHGQVGGFVRVAVSPCTA